MTKKTTETAPELVLVTDGGHIAYQVMVRETMDSFPARELEVSIFQVSYDEFDTETSKVIHTVYMQESSIDEAFDWAEAWIRAREGLNTEIRNYALRTVED